MKQITYLLLFLLPMAASAQQVFVSKGKIEFEKQVNIHREIDESWDNGEDNIWKQQMKKNVPKVQNSYFDLYFKDDKTLYKPGREAPPTLQKVPDWMNGPASDNIVMNDLSTHQTVNQKSVYEDTYLIQDSLAKIDWRITNDTRTIAGIECRKAVGKIMDSVYVIAFYTDIILSSGGPESITGLPGMILGVAIPRINTTWFATKVELVEVKDTDLAAPKKGKKSTYAALNTQLQKSMKDWGKNGQKNIWKIML